MDCKDSCVWLSVCNNLLRAGGCLEESRLSVLTWLFRSDGSQGPGYSGHTDQLSVSFQV